MVNILPFGTNAILKRIQKVHRMYVQKIYVRVKKKKTVEERLAFELLTRI